jgi:PKD repeat protein
MAVPYNGSPITLDQQIQFQPTNSWTFPSGTVFVKNFDLVVNETNATIRRLETQILVRDINGVVYGVTYKWRPDNSDADLLASSLSEGILITNTSGVRTQTWTYPGPSDCLACHTPVANYVLGVNARQLNGNLTYAATGVTDNQIRTLNRLGLLNPAINESGISGYAQMSSMTNLSASLQQRVRSYLDANCQACHQSGGDGPTWDARYDTPLALQHITNYPALFTLGISDNACVVKSKDIWRSVLLARINTTDQTIQMPDFRNLIDTNAVQILIAWINSLPGIPALAPVNITPNGGSFSNSVSVTIQPPHTNASIFYTLDGTLPTTNSLPYSGALTLTSDVTLAATAFETNYDNSVATSAQFIVSPQGLSVSPNSLDFGSVVLGQTNLLPFQVINTGSQTLTGSAAVSAPFSISSGNPFNLSANQTGQVVVAFTPAGATSYSNLVTFASNSGNSTNAVVGTGVTPAQLQSSPATLSFGWIAVSTSTSANLLVTNLGGAPLINGVALIGGGPFTVLSGTPFSLPGFGWTNIVVQFSPLGAGTFSNYAAITTANAGNSTTPLTGSGAVVLAASFVGNPTAGTVPLQVVFTDNSTGTITNRSWNFGDGSNTNTSSTSVTHTFSIVGTNNVSLMVSGPVGTNTQLRPNYIVATNLLPARLGVSPALIAFGYAATGTTAQASLLATNLGSAPLTNGVAVVGGGPFTILSGTPFNLPSSGSTNIVVRFSPASAGAFSNYIGITTANGGTSTNALTGSGAIPPAANFTGSPTSGAGPLMVFFSDTSTGTITNRFWDWGDGSSSNAAVTSLTHTYNVAGTNSVALTVTGPLGTNQLSRSAYIIVTNLGPVTVTIISTNNQVQLIWPAGTLQAAPAVTGTFLDVTNALSPFTVPKSSSPQFFRVRTR